MWCARRYIRQPRGKTDGCRLDDDDDDGSDDRGVLKFSHFPERLARNNRQEKRPDGRKQAQNVTLVPLCWYSAGTCDPIFGDF